MYCNDVLLQRVMEAIGVGEVGGVLPWRGGLMRRFCKPRSPLVGVCAALLPSLSGRNSGLHDQVSRLSCSGQPEH